MLTKHHYWICLAVYIKLLIIEKALLSILFTPECVCPCHEKHCDQLYKVKL